MLTGRELSPDKVPIDSLDGLRGMAALIVFLSHTSNDRIFLLPFLDCSGIGKMGVYLFFILSAFLLTVPFLRLGDAVTNKMFLLNYALRRFFRIYPLYGAYLVVALASSILLWRLFDLHRPVGIPFFLSWQDFVNHVLLMKGKGVTWSILVEFRYYLVLPLVAIMYSLILKKHVGASLGATFLMIAGCQLIWPQSESLANDTRLGPYLSIFLLGSLLALLFHRWEESSLADNKMAALVIEGLGILAGLTLIFMIPSVSSWVLGEDIPFNYYHKEFLLFGLLWSLVVFACVTGAGGIKKIFEAPALRFVGFVSFSVYLLHIVVIDLVKRLGVDNPMQGWLMLVLTLGLSYLSWRLIERPSSKVKLSLPAPSQARLYEKSFRSVG